MAASIIAVAMLAFIASSAPCSHSRELTFTLPHTLAPGESAWLVLKVGAIGHAEIQVTTSDCRQMGTISPFGPRAASRSGTYSLPVPPSAISNRHVTVRVSLNGGGETERPPTSRELIESSIRVRPAPK
ncbi:MAG TPA: hypothetical protein VKB38_16810 [Terracidiphilus sp.]|nr:hypothetical protein [Terracidiphilus sp.]